MITLQKNCKNWFIVFRRKGKLIWYPTHSADKNYARQLELEMKASFQRKRTRDQLAKFIERMTGEIVGEIHKPGMLLSSAWTIYRDKYCESHAESSTKKKEIEWGKFLKWLTAKRPDIEFMHEVDHLIAEEYQKVLDRECASGHYFNIRIGYIKNIFKRLEQHAGITKNPFDIVLLKPKEHVSYKALDDKEIKAILNKCKPEWKTACTIAQWTGLVLPTR